jgi:hypothetical protein
MMNDYYCRSVFVYLYYLNAMFYCKMSGCERGCIFESCAQAHITHAMLPKYVACHLVLFLYHDISHQVLYDLPSCFSFIQLNFVPL